MCFFLNLSPQEELDTCVFVFNTLRVTDAGMPFKNQPGRKKTSGLDFYVDLGGGFKYFSCSPLFGEDSHFDYYFSIGLKPPASLDFYIDAFENHQGSLLHFKYCRGLNLRFFPGKFEVLRDFSQHEISVEQWKNGPNGCWGDVGDDKLPSYIPGVLDKPWNKDSGTWTNQYSRISPGFWSTAHLFS